MSDVVESEVVQQESASLNVNEAEPSRMERAAAALGETKLFVEDIPLDEDTFVVDEDEEESDDDAADEDVEEDDSEVVEDEEDDEEDKEEDEKPEEPEGWQWALLRKRDKALTEREQSLDSDIGRVQKLQAEVQTAYNEVGRLRSLAERSPEKFMEAVGLDPVQVYHRWTDMINGDAPEFREKREEDPRVLEEFRKLRAELEAEKAERLKFEKEREQMRLQKEVEHALNTHTSVAMDIMNTDEGKTEFPSLALVPDVDRRELISRAIAWHMDNSPDDHLDVVMKKLDNYMKPKVDYYRGIFGATQENGQPSKKEAVGSGKPSKKPSAKRRTPNNKDQSERNTYELPGKRERLARAAALVPDFEVGTF